jgi:hypothetical protein
VGWVLRVAERDVSRNAFVEALAGEDPKGGGEVLFLMGASEVDGWEGWGLERVRGVFWADVVDVLVPG